MKWLREVWYTCRLNTGKKTVSADAGFPPGRAFVYPDLALYERFAKYYYKYDDEVYEYI